MIFFSSALTAITPYVTTCSRWALLAVRVSIGLVHGLAYTLFMSIISKWSVRSEMARYLEVFSLAEETAPLITAPFGAFLSERVFFRGWPDIYYVYSLIGAVLLPIWMFVVTSAPQDHRWIHTSEMALIQENPLAQQRRHTSIPWKKIVTSGPVLAMVTGSFCYSWFWSAATVTLPEFYKNAFNIKLEQNGLFSAIPFLFSLVFSVFVAVITDFVINAGILSTTTTRKLILSFSLAGSSLLFVFSTFLDFPGHALLVCVISLATGFTIMNRGCVALNIFDIAPNYSGVLTAFSVTVFSLSQILQPSLAGFFIDGHASKVRYRQYYGILAGLMAVGIIVYTTFGSAEMQDWNNEEDVDEKTGKDEEEPFLQ